MDGEHSGQDRPDMEEDVTVNIEEAVALEEKLFKQRMEIRKKKGHDYADNNNIHLNFDVIAEICKLLKVDVTTPYGVAFLYKVLKLQREANLLFMGKTPANEALLDTFLDEANYHDLELEILVREGIVKLDD
jgi:hypothetical protein